MARTINTGIVDDISSHCAHGKFILIAVLENGLRVILRSFNLADYVRGREREIRKAFRDYFCGATIEYHFERHGSETYWVATRPEIPEEITPHGIACRSSVSP